jgi:signal transduction histidine kinase
MAKGPDNRVEPLTLAGIVHDLNNMFETLFETAEVLAEDPKYAKLSATMMRSLKHGARIVKSLEEKGGLTDVDRLLEQAGALLNDYLISSRGPSISLVVKVERGLQLRGMRGAWERVFLNLFLNAARMMPDGGVIEVEAAREEDGWAFYIRDTGPGVPARLLPKLFEPGFTTTPRHKGLGLHIVKSVVESFGGTVSARNREDTDGAEFRIHLPDAPG